ncbi:hypothetical protein GUJ93_ZPchr0006g43539 [Zizania palustris]|uniref:HD domain-containing protein n=1 Tax=Zizania palustris TaxID=103762 RepID=A0A8J5W1K1_ZIZPA|nr:hypothetical protein GUJ93_ZPchr0006g43539 [Zizania palustris]
MHGTYTYTYTYLPLPFFNSPLYRLPLYTASAPHSLYIPTLSPSPPRRLCLPRPPIAASASPPSHRRLYALRPPRHLCLPHPPTTASASPPPPHRLCLPRPPIAASTPRGLHTTSASPALPPPPPPPRPLTAASTPRGLPRPPVGACASPPTTAASPPSPRRLHAACASPALPSPPPPPRRLYAAASTPPLPPPPSHRRLRLPALSPPPLCPEASTSPPPRHHVFHSQHSAMYFILNTVPSIVGDITPSDGVPKEEKSRREKEALDHMCGLLGGGPRAEEISELWMEYEQNATLEAIRAAKIGDAAMATAAAAHDKRTWLQ